VFAITASPGARCARRNGASWIAASSSGGRVRSSVRGLRIATAIGPSTAMRMMSGTASVPGAAAPRRAAAATRRTPKARAAEAAPAAASTHQADMLLVK